MKDRNKKRRKTLDGNRERHIFAAITQTDTHQQLRDIVSRFDIEGHVTAVQPLGEGLINDSYGVDTDVRPKAYVLQRINHNVFRDVDMLQDNIEKVTRHIHRKLVERGETDIDRKVLRFTRCGDKTYYFDGKDYWRLMVFIRDSYTHQSVNPQYSYCAGRAFGDFQSMLADISEPLGETIRQGRTPPLGRRRSGTLPVARRRDVPRRETAPRGQAAETHLPLRHEGQ